MFKTDARVCFIDELRGLVIILMIFYHSLYDIVFVFYKSDIDFYSKSLNLTQLFIATTFVCLAGIVSNYSKNNLKRGIECLAFGFLLTLITHFIMPSQLIVFGVLHLLGTSMIIYHFLKKVLKKIPTFIGTIIFLLLFSFTYSMPYGYMGFFGNRMLVLPPDLYTVPFLFLFGFPSPSFRSSDYFPIFPWIFLFICGTFIGNLFREDRMPEFFYKPHIKPLAFLGRHSLIIYLIHQPVIYGSLYLAFNIFG